MIFWLIVSYLVLIPITHLLTYKTFEVYCKKTWPVLYEVNEYSLLCDEMSIKTRIKRDRKINFLFCCIWPLSVPMFWVPMYIKIKEKKTS